MHKYLLAFFATVTFLFGCTVNATSVVTTPSSSLSATATTEVPSTVSATNTLIPPAEITATQALTPTQSSAAVAQMQRVCSNPPQRFGFSAELNIDEIVHLRFEREELLTFEGWTARPAPSVTPVTPEPTPSIRPAPNASSRILLIGGQLSLSNGQLDSRTLEFDPLLNNPCGEECPLEVISQSPDGKWQLVQVNDWLQDKMGIWLVGDAEIIRLVPYVSDPSWRWSNDGSLLWFVSNDPNDVGGRVLLVQPGDPVIINEAERGSLLDPFFYFLAFSPVDKTALSVPSFEQGENRLEELYKVDLTTSQMEATEVQTISGIAAVIWNEATESFLLQVVNESDIEIRDLQENTVITIPYTTLESVIPALSGEQNTLSRGLSRLYALSHSGRYLAVIHSPREIWLFDCEED